jgi:catechol 2,3-dioxygenase-like lactoylglutathione lyase family enzyme
MVERLAARTGFDGVPASEKCCISVLKSIRESVMGIYTHVTVGTNNLEMARAFYDNVLGKIGLKRLDDLGDRGAGWGRDLAEFYVLTPANGQLATVANGGTISFEAPNRASIHAFYDAALEAGAKDEGPAGPRDSSPNAYAAYVRDLDGNKLAVYCFATE